MKKNKLPKSSLPPSLPMKAKAVVVSDQPGESHLEKKLQPEAKVKAISNLPTEEKQVAKVSTKKTYTLKFYMMILSGVASVVGLGLFILYVFTLNMIFGGLGIVMAVVGIFVFRYYWKKEDSFSIEHLDGVKKSESFNSLNLHPNKVEFADVYEPQGFPMLCLNDKKKYYVNIFVENKLVPFILPDQQYCDPIVFAQRVLGLPAHRKIFERKPKLLQRLKTALLVVAIGIVWLLILTTTGAE